MKTRMLLAVAGALAMAACARETPAGNDAVEFDEAAAQDTPQAWNAFDNSAEVLRDTNVSDPVAVEAALDAAANAPETVERNAR